MCFSVVAPCSSLLKPAGESKSLHGGRFLHGFLIRDGHVSDPRIAHFLIHMFALPGPPSDPWSLNMLLKAYGSHGFLEDSKDLFSIMSCRDVISWTTMISLLSQHGCQTEAVQTYHQMLVEGIMPNVVSFVNVLNACGNLRALVAGITIHITSIESGCDDKEDVILVTSLVKMYGDCGQLSVAWSIFRQSKNLDIVAWNAMISVFIQNDELYNALEAFAMAPKRDSATWNTVIGGLAQNGHGNMALKLFCQMNLEGVKPNVVTFVCVLNAFTSTMFLEGGRMVHMLIVDAGLERGIKIENALISMYGRCRDMDDAKSIFESMQCRNVISWTAIIAAWCETGHFEKAVENFKQMLDRGVQPDKVSFLCSLDACAMLSTLEEGTRMNATICKLGIENHWMIETALINMYGKCGSIQEARYVFGHSLEKTIEMQNALMTTFSHGGLLDEIETVFREMRHHNIIPNSVTFSCVLAACSHSGLVDEASHAFLSISRVHGVSYTEDHFLCIVDLFARAGQLEKAQEMVQNLPFGLDDCLAWQCLLSGCKIHNDVDRALHVVKHCIDIDPNNAPMYGILSLFAISGDNLGVHGNLNISDTFAE